MESNLNPEIIHDTIDKEPRPEESRKEGTRRQPILVKEEQTGHCLGREEVMQTQRKSRNEKKAPILRQPTLKLPAETRSEVEEENNMEEDRKEEKTEIEKEEVWLRGGQQKIQRIPPIL